MKKYIFWGIVLFIISLAIGYFYGQRIFSGTALVEENTITNNNKVEQNKIPTNTIIQTSYEEIKILPSTKLGIKKLYKGCNHISFEFVELPKELINKTKEEVEKIYREWKTEEFNESKVVLYKEVEGICDEHFLITLGDKFVEVYKFTDENYNKILYTVTDISKEYLTEEDVEKLKNGIKLYGKDMLNSALEDFE